jgi:hypothetical protein
MAAWLQRGVAAARIGGERSDLWIPGALASLVFLGWSPFVLAVVPLPGASDLAFFGADVYTSSRWPANALALGAGVMLLLLAASLLIALAETTLLRRLRRLRQYPSLNRRSRCRKSSAFRPMRCLLSTSRS